MSGLGTIVEIFNRDILCAENIHKKLKELEQNRQEKNRVKIPDYVNRRLDGIKVQNMWTRKEIILLLKGEVIEGRSLLSCRNKLNYMQVVGEINRTEKLRLSKQLRQKYDNKINPSCKPIL